MRERVEKPNVTRRVFVRQMGRLIPGAVVVVLRGQGRGVAQKSLHMQGRAIDVRLTDVASADLRDAAIALKRGGVGYYRQSDFVHLDTGRFRTW